MKLEAVTVCARAPGRDESYADFLAIAAKHNRHLFDAWVVVTNDPEAREVCRRYSLDCLQSEDGDRGGADFNKGRLVERGLQHLSAEGFRLHLDADILLPTDARRRLEAAHLDPACVYGVDRVMVRSYEQYLKLAASGYLDSQHDYHNRLRWPAGYDVGARWVDRDVSYAPCGFFQLWHSSADEWRGARVKKYPAGHGNACRSDIRHALQWDRRHRVLLPDLIAVHLESEPARLGANWRGRTTRRFGPPPAGAAPAAGGPS